MYQHIQYIHSGYCGIIKIYRMNIRIFYTVGKRNNATVREGGRRIRR